VLIGAAVPSAMMDLSINDNALSINDNELSINNDELSINDNALSINGNQLSIAGEMRLCTSSCRRWKSNSAGLERAGHGTTKRILVLCVCVCAIPL
jgi:hypothetical protein